MKGINILMISNWSINEGITHSTIHQLLYFLEKDDRIEKIYLSTTELDTKPQFSSSKVVHCPVRKDGENLIQSIVNNFRKVLFLRKIIIINRISFIWSRGSAAGFIGVGLQLLTRVPIIIDSFEPHSLYMAETRTWSRFGIKFIFQRLAERFMKKKSFAILPVSHCYYNKLIKEGVNSGKLMVFPCVVDTIKFRFDESSRKQVRRELGVTQSDIVGIYVGKFGGLYYGKEAFRLFRSAFKYWGDQFFLIILTEMTPSYLDSISSSFPMPKNRVIIKKVEHDDVPGYLSGADIAFSTIKSVEAMKYCSPIKHGEYWAADLPIITTLGFGDDTEIIKRENGGYIVKIEESNFDSVFSQVGHDLKNGRIGKYHQLAKKFRDKSKIEDVLNFILDNFFAMSR